MPRILTQPVLATWPVQLALQLLLVVATSFGSLGLARGDWYDDVGYTKLESVLGDNLPTGQGVYVSQVEAGSGSTSNDYFPDASFSDFGAGSDPLGQPVTFVNGSYDAHSDPGVLNHATGVGKFFYGNTLSMASGANTVVVYEVGDYLDTFLQCGSSSCGTATPEAPTFTDPNDGLTKYYVVQNHSWIGTTGSTTGDKRALRKVDYLVDQYELTMAVGLRNGNPDSNPHPPIEPYNLLANSYNAIVVGRSDGLNSINSTTLSGYGPGREKPTLVVGGTGSLLNTTSRATAAVSGAAAIFHQVLAGTDGSRSETMRAILLAGATKDEFTNYVDPATEQVDPWDRDPNQPLDNIFGAGELNVLNSYLITQGGQSAGGTSTPTPVGSYGWDYQTVNAANPRQYKFEIPAGTTATEVSIMLTWNAETTSPFNTQSLANLDLTLTDGGSPVDVSLSTIDNVEHIYIGPGQAVPSLGPGTYTLEVSTNLERDYGIAWRMSTLFDEPSADFDEDGDVDGTDFLTWQRGVGTLVNAAHADGDADGDGDIDHDDLTIFESQYGIPPLVASVTALPEPGALALALVSGAMLLFTSRRRG